jgi:hypothetical protein
MASVTDVDSDLRSLARRVPEDVRASLTPVELRLRCTEAAQLIGDSEVSGDDRKRSRAQKLLKAASSTSYSMTMSVLSDELRQAQLDRDDGKAYEIQQAMRRYDRENPQPSENTVIAHIRAELPKLKIPGPPPPSRSALGRRFGMKSRKGRY